MDPYFAKLQSVYSVEFILDLKQGIAALVIEEGSISPNSSLEDWKLEVFPFLNILIIYAI